MRKIMASMALIGLAVSTSVSVEGVEKGRVVDGKQYYIDSDGECFRLGSDGGVIYADVECAPEIVSAAVAGAILGGVLGAKVNGKQYYRDTRGYCYYVDQYGQPHYDYNTRC